MLILFWVSFILLAYVYFGYLILLLLYLPKINKDKNKKHFIATKMPNISILIPVYNEEKIIEEKINNTLLLKYPKNKVEIIIISDGSIDRTKEIVKKYRNKGIKYFEQPMRSGKASALNKGLREAKNEIIVFSDASILLRKDALYCILQRFSDNTIGCVSGEDYIYGGGEEGIYGKYELLLRNLESKISSIVGASGCFYAQRRCLCDLFPEGLAPDFFSVLKTVEKGFKAVTEPKAKGFMRSVPDPKREFNRKVRTLLRGITTLMQFKFLLNPFQYGMFSIQLISHKLFRWMAGILLILMFFSNLFLLSSKMYFIFFGMQVVFYSLAVIGLMGLSKAFVFRIPFFFSMVNFASLVAWFKYFVGVRQEIWEPSKR
jgi:glycosyltransferase involved in cell wall biosynthesis